MAAAKTVRPAKPVRPAAGVRVHVWGLDAVVERDQWGVPAGKVKVRWDAPGHSDHGTTAVVPLDRIEVVEEVNRNADLGVDPPLDIEPGDTLELERHPIYDHPGSTPSYRVSKKVVKTIEWKSPDRASVTLRGMRSSYAGGVTIDTRFKLSGSDEGGWWVTKLPPRPSRYLLLEVHKGRGVRSNPDGEVLGVIEETLDLQRNPRARAIGDRPSMETGFFGKDLDDDQIDDVAGAEGEHLDAAMRRYKTFHAKDPIRIAELTHDLPTRWREVGDALAVMYRTDKWKKDGNDEDYKHLHDKADGKPYDVGQGVRIYEPVRGGGGRSLPVPRPRALTLLGYCLGVFVRKDDDSEIYEANPRGCYLFSSPSGDMLALYSPHQQSNGSSGFLAVLAGGKLRVLKDGIDG